jgi:hypothetical protein
MWEARTQVVPSGIRFQIFQGPARLSFRELFGLLENDSDFGQWYGETLANCGLAAFFWEHPPLTIGTFDDEAEFVLLESSALAGLRPEPEPFEPEFAAHPAADVLTFPNLGGDAQLVVPRPIGPIEAYGHLAVFVRSAPRAQVQSLWKAAAQLLHDNLNSTPRWLSTAGLGVSWLHIRLDTRPKYYRFAPYTVAI